MRRVDWNILKLLYIFVVNAFMSGFSFMQEEDTGKNITLSDDKPDG